jgi:DNA-binding transcriptional regulator YdaS (Cro superfamily)
MKYPAFADWFGQQFDRLGVEKDADMARRIGVAESMVNRWKAGATLPSPESCQKIATGVGVSPDEVLIAAGYKAGKVAPHQRSIVDLVDELAARVRQSEARYRTHDAVLFAGPVIPAGADPNQGADMLVNEDRFVVEVIGDCLEPDIESGVHLLMSKSRPFGEGDVVLVVVNGEYHLKRVIRRNGVTELSSRRGRLSVPSDGVTFKGSMIRPLGR